MAWCAIYENTTGRLVSISDPRPGRIPNGHTAIDLAQRPDLGVVMWDEATRVFVSRPARPPHRAMREVLAAQPEIQALPAGTRTTIAAVSDRVEDEVRRG